MKIITILSIVMFLFITNAEAGIYLTKEQDDNLIILHEKIAERYPQFKGFSGPRENKQVHGISDETAEVEISIIDIPTIKAEKEAEKQAKKDAKKLKKFKEGDTVEDKLDEIIDYLNSQIQEK